MKALAATRLILIFFTPSLVGLNSAFAQAPQPKQVAPTPPSQSPVKAIQQVAPKPVAPAPSPQPPAKAHDDVTKPEAPASAETKAEINPREKFKMDRKARNEARAKVKAAREKLSASKKAGAADTIIHADQEALKAAIQERNLKQAEVVADKEAMGDSPKKNRGRRNKKHSKEPNSN